jgi:hypothetical protein
MSLFQDISTYLGTGSAPVVVAGFVFGVFELGEKLASPQARTALTHWLQTAEVRKVAGLPQYTMEIFQRIFGERHFSLQCLWRSTAFSVGSMLVLFFMVQLIRGIFVFPVLIKYREIQFTWLSFMLVWLGWAILIDYLSLLKTRVILHLFIRAKTCIRGFVLVFDLGLYCAIFFVAAFVTATVAALKFYMIVNGEFLELSLDDMVVYGSQASMSPEEDVLLGTFIPTIFLGGLAPSAWLWLYVAALFVTRSLLRSETLINWLRWFLDIGKAPFRSVGAVAAGLTFVMSTSVLLVAHVV